MTEPGPPAVYATFVGEINQATARSLVHGCSAASVDRASHLHLMFQSTGGGVAEGVYLHNFFKSFSVPTTLYNVGSVSSAAVLVFLGCQSRIAHEHATFMIHRVQTNPQIAGRSRLLAASRSLNIDDSRADKILRDHVSLSRARWRQYDRDFLWLTAKEAVSSGIASAIGHFAPPPGSLIYDFGWPAAT